MLGFASAGIIATKSSLANITNVGSSSSPDRYMFRQENQHGVVAGRLVGNTQPQASVTSSGSSRRREG